MKLYIAHCIDRHIDPVIRVFDTSDAAIAFAKAFAVKESRNGAAEESQIEGWLYYATYSSESDHVYVTETELNDATL